VINKVLNVQCRKCGAKNELSNLPAPGEKFKCGTCKSLLWQQPRTNWIALEDYEATKEERELLRALDKTNRGIRLWARAHKELTQWSSGKTPLGFLAWLRWLAFLIPLKACGRVATGEIAWWQLLLVAFGLFFIVSAIDPIWRRHKVSSLSTKIRQLEHQLGGSNYIRAEIEHTYSQWIESKLKQ
jgi:hypothetical protein